MPDPRIASFDSALVEFTEDEWPIIAEARGDDSQSDRPATALWSVVVRQHSDGRRLVYAAQRSDDRGPLLAFHTVGGFRNVSCGFLLDTKPPMGAQELEAATTQAVRYAAGVIHRECLAGECIAHLPVTALN